jgi:SAM-dependent methyltransferase
VSIDEAAIRGFASGAEAYERGRPGYPDQAVAWLVAQLGLRPGARVADVGAGTGKLTRLLVRSGAELIAVEPVGEMRAILARALPSVRALEGTADALPLEDASVDAIVVAQAFHWFARRETLAEFHRVLRSGGRLGLIWNSRDESQPLQQRIEEIIAPYRRGTPSHKSGEWRRAFDGEPTLFAPVHELAVEFEQSTTPEVVVDRALSTSFIAALEDGERARVAERVRALAQREPPLLAYRTEISVYERRG